MGLIRRLLGDRSTEASPDPIDPDRPTWMRDGMQVELLDGRETLEGVGEANYQEALWGLVGGWREEHVRHDALAVLYAEADNPYDTNAVSVWVNGLKVGYLSREQAAKYREGLLALEAKYGSPIALRGMIVGGGMRADGPGRLGIFLSHEPADFGVLATGRAGRRSAGGMRTGLSDAIATDDIDDSYDIDWLASLPNDGLAAITQLRDLLTHERDPIDRHFMFCELERRLYQSRDVFTSALDEYDDSCRSHDSEMDAIREAFMTKWGNIPVLETYRQMAIRQQKAKRFDQALWWAERGLAVYGTDAARPDAVEDLSKRVDLYRGKILSQAENS